MKAVYIAPRQPSPGSAEELAGRPVSDIMSQPVAYVSAGTPLGEALRVMVRLRHRHLVVVDGEGRCVGVLSDRVIAAAWAHDPTSLDREPAGGTLPAAAPVVGPRARVLDAARLMRNTGTDAVVVADETGAPVGIVTGTDLVALLAR
jgi:CBS domain-containing protein